MPNTAGLKAQREVERKARRARRKRFRKVRRYLLVVGVGALGLLIIVGLAIPSLPSPQRSAGGTGEGPGTIVADLGRGHFPVGSPAPPGYYNSVPPTSGTHAPSWTRCGLHREPIADEIQVHNLEHGYVLIQFNPTNLSIRDGLAELAEQLPGWPNYYVVAPNPDIEQPIALTAWARTQYLDNVDGNAIRAFAEAYRGLGPEIGSPPCEAGNAMGTR
jgi:hypothetical protein